MEKLTVRLSASGFTSSEFKKLALLHAKIIKKSLPSFNFEYDFNRAMMEMVSPIMVKEYNSGAIKKRYKMIMDELNSLGYKVEKDTFPKRTIRDRYSKQLEYCSLLSGEAVSSNTIISAKVGYSIDEDYQTNKSGPFYVIVLEEIKALKNSKVDNEE